MDVTQAGKRKEIEKGNARLKKLVTGLSPTSCQAETFRIMITCLRIRLTSIIQGCLPYRRLPFVSPENQINSSYCPKWTEVKKVIQIAQISGNRNPELTATNQYQFQSSLPLLTLFFGSTFLITWRIIPALADLPGGDQTLFLISAASGPFHCRENIKIINVITDMPNVFSNN
jgi:hypothetical protein